MSEHTVLFIGDCHIDNAKLIDTLKEHDIVVIGAGSPVTMLNTVDLVSAMEIAAWKTPSYLNQPEYGHYRKDFRTGKPLRY